MREQTAASITKAAVVIGTFSALSIAGGLIKIPSPIGSIALDSAPGFFTAAFYGPLLGAAVGAIGHMGSAATGGMPLGALHIMVAILMAIVCWIFGFLARRGASVYLLVVAAVLAVALNGIVVPLVLTLVPGGLPKEMAFTLMPILCAASATNIILASFAAWSSTKFKPGA
jgi:uncharacterized membrane protein